MVQSSALAQIPFTPGVLIHNISKPQPFSDWISFRKRNTISFWEIAFCWPCFRSLNLCKPRSFVVSWKRDWLIRWAFKQYISRTDPLIPKIMRNLCMWDERVKRNSFQDFLHKTQHSVCLRCIWRASTRYSKASHSHPQFPRSALGRLRPWLLF